MGKMMEKISIDLIGNKLYGYYSGSNQICKFDLDEIVNIFSDPTGILGPNPIHFTESHKKLYGSCDFSRSFLDNNFELVPIVDDPEQIMMSSKMIRRSKLYGRNSGSFKSSEFLEKSQNLFYGDDNFQSEDSNSNLAKFVDLKNNLLSDRIVGDLVIELEDDTENELQSFEARQLSNGQDQIILTFQNSVQRIYGNNNNNNDQNFSPNFEINIEKSTQFFKSSANFDQFLLSQTENGILLVGNTNNNCQIAKSASCCSAIGNPFCQWNSENNQCQYFSEPKSRPVTTKIQSQKSNSVSNQIFTLKQISESCQKYNLPYLSTPPKPQISSFGQFFKNLLSSIAFLNSSAQNNKDNNNNPKKQIQQIYVWQLIILIISVIGIFSCCLFTCILCVKTKYKYKTLKKDTRKLHSDAKEARDLLIECQQQQSSSLATTPESSGSGNSRSENLILMDETSQNNTPRSEKMNEINENHLISDQNLRNFQIEQHVVKLSNTLSLTDKYRRSFKSKNKNHEKFDYLSRKNSLQQHLSQKVNPRNSYRPSETTQCLEISQQSQNSNLSASKKEEIASEGESENSATLPNPLPRRISTDELIVADNPEIEKEKEIVETESETKPKIDNP